MSLSVGTRLGPYEILAPLGAGGMGEVYKARDRYPWTSYDVAPDGRFLAIVPALVAEQPLTVVVNWTAERGESARR